MKNYKKIKLPLVSLSVFFLLASCSTPAIDSQSSSIEAIDSKEESEVVSSEGNSSSEVTSEEVSSSESSSSESSSSESSSSETVIKRNLTWNFDGGVATNEYTSGEIAVGETIVEPILEKEGYTFNGWDKEVPSVMLEYDLSFNAQWTINQYTITFNTNGGNEIAPITENYGTAIIAPADPVRLGYTFSGWDKEIPTTMPSSDMVINALWDENEYVISYKDEGNETYSGSNLSALPTVHAYSSATPLVAGEKEGYTFSGWYDNASCSGDPLTEVATNISNDVTLYAKWNINSYTLTWNLDGGVASNEYTSGEVAYGTSIIAPIGVSKDGYTFTNWNGEVPITMPAHDLSFTAIYGVQVYNISYKDEGSEDYSGNNLSSLITQHTFGGETVLVNGTKEGYRFDGWYLDASCSTSPVATLGATDYTSDIVLYAKWTKTYNINYYDVGGEAFSGIHGENAPTNFVLSEGASLVDASKEGYSFGGWHLESDAHDDPITTLEANTYIGEVNLYADWKKFGTGNVFKAEKINGTQAIAIDGDKDDAYNDATPIAINTVIDGDTSITATAYIMWNDTDLYIYVDVVDTTNKCYFFGDISNHDYLSLFIDLLHNDDNDPSNPPSWGEGYRGSQMCEGWFNIARGGAQYNESSDPRYGDNSEFSWVGWMSNEAKNSGHTVGTAKTEDNRYGVEYRIDCSFNDNIPTSLRPHLYQEIGVGISVTDREGDNRNGAIAMENVNANATASPRNLSNIKLVDDIDKDDYHKYTITFDSNGGSAVNPITQVRGTALVAPTAPTLTGYDFAGWDPTFPSVMPEENITLTAQWTPKSYNISYKDEGGSDYSGNNSEALVASHTYGSATNLVSGTKEGYSFAGWYDNADCTGSALTSIAANYDGEDIVLYAKWADNPVITFDTDGGSAIDSIIQAPGTEVIAPENPTKDYYDFAGWNPTLPTTMPESNLTVVAQWTPKSYNINYKDEGDADYSGSNLSDLPFSHTYNTALVLVDGVKEGYRLKLYHQLT